MTLATEAMDTPTASSSTAKLQGYDLYRALGSPRHVVAPMVDASELAWRVFSRSPVDPATLGDGEQLAEEAVGADDLKGKGRAALPAAHLAYTPMILARLFSVSPAVLWPGASWQLSRRRPCRSDRPGSPHRRWSRTTSRLVGCSTSYAVSSDGWAVLLLAKLELRRGSR